MTLERFQIRFFTELISAKTFDRNSMERVTERKNILYLINFKAHRLTEWCKWETKNELRFTQFI